MSLTIEPGDVVQFRLDSICRGTIGIVGELADGGERFCVVGGGAWWDISEVTLVAKGVNNMPKPDPLTKREEFAKSAMQGLLANCDRNTDYKGFAVDAVAKADALIDELAKGT